MTRSQHTYRCSECGDRGHNARTCPKLGGQRQPAGRAGQAARYLREHGGTYKTAGQRFGITRQAVEQAWHKLGFGDTPQQIEWTRTRGQIRDLARQGLTAPAIAKELGVSDRHVRNVAYHAGIEIAPMPTLTDLHREDILAAAALVSAGKITLTEAGHRADVPEELIRPFVTGRRLYHRGIDYRDRDELGRSKAQRGSELVDQGLHPTDAARQVGISSRTIYSYRRRRGLPPRCCPKRRPGPRRA